MLDVISKLRMARISPQKARLLGDIIVGKTVDVALNQLTYLPNKSAKMVKKIIESALSNAENNYGLDIDNLYIHSYYVDEGPVFKRFHARARGRGNRITKRTSHITVALRERMEALD